MSKKLIIWDFDDVISDSEKLWCQLWQKQLNTIGINWDLQKCMDELAGVCMNDKSKNLKKKYNIDLPENFENKVYQNVDDIIKNELTMIDGIENCFKISNFKHCIATDGNYEKTYLKMESIDLYKYVSKENVFSSEELPHGKPEPEIFLLPLTKLGYKKEDAIVIEDSIAGITAANRAGIDVIAFIETKSENDKKYFEELNKLNTYKICKNAKELEETLLKQL